jgi:hypothetical protein
MQGTEDRINPDELAALVDDTQMAERSIRVFLLILNRLALTHQWDVDHREQIKWQAIWTSQANGKLVENVLRGMFGEPGHG